jgi:hypothetical protein
MGRGQIAALCPHVESRSVEDRAASEAAQPPTRMRPIVDRARSQRLARLIARCTGPRPLDGARGRLRRLGWRGHFIGDKSTTPTRIAAQLPQDRSLDSRAATNADAVALTDATHRTVRMVPIGTGARMRPVHDLRRR